MSSSLWVTSPWRHLPNHLISRGLCLYSCTDFTSGVHTAPTGLYMPEKTVFPNAGGANLTAQLDLPDTGDPKAFALFAHCFTCGRDLTAARNISRSLVALGFGVLRFDFTGLGESEGNFPDTTFSSNVEDLISASEFLADKYEAPKILIGHSLGGAAVLQAASSIPSAVAIATVGAPCEPGHVKKLLGNSLDEIQRTGSAQVSLAGRSFTIRSQFLDDLNEVRMKETIRGLNRALLVCHSPIDQTVGIDNAGRIFDEALHPKSFLSLDTANHLLTDPRDSQYVGSVIGTWAARFIEESRPPSPSPSDDGVSVCIGREHYRTEIMAGSHSLTADEPQSLGGTGRGGTPYDLLLSALRACTAITLRMYADRKEWPLEEARVRLRHAKVHANDCEECESKDGRVDVIDREIELTGQLDAEQLLRLLEIADRCPVHRTLHSQIVVRTELREGQQRRFGW